jgi:hypothetical protein
VAGVVGTDFYVGYENNVMNVMAYEGSVRVCNLAGVCVILKAGQMTNLRNGDNSLPAPPTQAPLDLLVTASKDTTVEPPPGRGLLNAGHMGKGLRFTIGVIAVVPVAVFSVLATRHTPAPVPTNPCKTNPTNCG